MTKIVVDDHGLVSAIGGFGCIDEVKNEQIYSNLTIF